MAIASRKRTFRALPAMEKATDDPIIGHAILTRKQVCRWLQISERQFYRLGLPAIRVGKRGVRYHARSVLEYLDRERVA